jgi:PTH1 family peptidyl-tRNA hydrolase
MVIDDLISKCKIIESQKTRSGLVIKASVSNTATLIVKPSSFINNSGPNVQLLIKNNNIEPEEIMIVLDDLNLELGNLRLRTNGSSGGHNGLKSIISSLQTMNFPRLRIGIGTPPTGNNQVDHVLGIIPKTQRKIVLSSIDKASNALICTLEEGLNSAMDNYNQEN